MNISPLDWLVIGVYFLVVTAIGPMAPRFSVTCAHGK